MSPAKTAAQRKADERQRHRDAGRVAVTVYVRPEWRGNVRDLECGLRNREKMENAMGYMRHDAIVVTSWNSAELDKAASKARKLGLVVAGPSKDATNGYASFLVCPDGSNEGWEESDTMDAKREAFTAYLNGVRYADNSTPLHWVALSYSSDDGEAKVVAHAWEVPLID